MHEVLVNCLGGLSLPRKSVVRLTDSPDITLDAYRGCKTTMQQLTKLIAEIFFAEKSLGAFFWKQKNAIVFAYSKFEI